LELDSLLDIMKMYKDKGETYDPSEHGFVFSEQQIDARRCARNHETLAAKACGRQEC
jgi:hypothetical protein